MWVVCQGSYFTVFLQWVSLCLQDIDTEQIRTTYPGWGIMFCPTWDTYCEYFGSRCQALYKELKIFWNWVGSDCLTPKLGWGEMVKLTVPTQQPSQRVLGCLNIYLLWSSHGKTWWWAGVRISIWMQVLGNRGSELNHGHVHVEVHWNLSLNTLPRGQWLYLEDKGMIPDE